VKSVAAQTLCFHGKYLLLLSNFIRQALSIDSKKVCIHVLRLIDIQNFPISTSGP